MPLSQAVIRGLFSASEAVENHQLAFQLDVRWDGGGAVEKGPSDFKERIGIVPSAVVRMRKSPFLSVLVIAPQYAFEY